jgi:YNFM family putative membrane transporter
MFGRIAAGVITDFSSWRIAIMCIGLVGLFCSWWFWRYLPASTHFVAQPFSAREHWYGLMQQLQDPGQLCLYGVAFLLMGSFVTLYSYLEYQLIAPPYNLSQGLIGWIFAIYIVGSFGSSCLSSLADRGSQQKILLLSIALIGVGAMITLNASLVIKVFGVALVTFGFFGGHAIASGWVGKRAGMRKAQASALYLFFYYVGSSVGNTAGGFFWSMNGWTGVIMMIMAFVLGNVLLALLLPVIPAQTQEMKMPGKL